MLLLNIPFRVEKYKPSKVAHSGVDPLGSFQAFVKHDPIKNIDIWRDERPKVDVKKEFGFMQGKVPVGTTTHTFQTGKLGNSGRLIRNNIETKELPRNPTDHVSYDPPTATRPQQRVYDLMMTQPRYGKNHQSSANWVPYDQREKEEKQKPKSKASAHSNMPRTEGSQKEQQVISKSLNNRSSCVHNIITGKSNPYSHDIKPGLLDKQICNRKLGIAEIRDLAGPNAINRHPDYVKAIDTNKNVFKRQNGIFTHLYDAAYRFGET